MMTLPPSPRTPLLTICARLLQGRKLHILVNLSPNVDHLRIRPSQAHAYTSLPSLLFLCSSRRPWRLILPRGRHAAVAVGAGLACPCRSSSSLPTSVSSTMSPREGNDNLIAAAVLCPPSRAVSSHHSHDYSHDFAYVRAGARRSWEGGFCRWTRARVGSMWPAWHCPSCRLASAPARPSPSRSMVGVLLLRMLA